MTQFTGEYNASTYVVKKDGEVVYQAGNSPYDSQAYVRRENGVGKQKMKEFCQITTKEMAEEKQGLDKGVKYNPVIEIPLSKVPK